MKEKIKSIGERLNELHMSQILRRLVAAWMAAALILYWQLPGALRSLQGVEGLEAMSFLRLLIITAVVFVLLMVLGTLVQAPRAERWLLTGLYAGLLLLSVAANETAFFLQGGLLLFFLMLVYAMFGWDASQRTITREKGKDKTAMLAVLAYGAAFYLFLKDWTVSRYLSFSNSTFDFGIFAQAFHYLRTTLIPFTTVEREGLLSHFAVHVSPIFYTVLPVYALFPDPATLQVIQAALMASAVIPIWLLGRHYGFSGIQRLMFCLVLILYPAYSGGVSYDFHENCFLTPLLMWLFYGLERKSKWQIALFSLLTLMVKEDAAVYIAVLGLWLLVCAMVKKEDRPWNGLAGLALVAGAAVWFSMTTGYLAKSGDGVMTGRYGNFYFGGDETLITAVKAVLMCPMKALFECMDEGKMEYLHLTMLALAWMPLLTRRYERLILLIPYLLINLLPDYPYQHDYLFQYSFGSAAFMLYLSMMNYSDLKEKGKGETAQILLITAIVFGAMLFGQYVRPEAEYHTEIYEEYQDRYETRAQVLTQIPEDASVSATTYLAPHLSQRDILYDIRYCTAEQMLSTEYVLIDPGVSGCLANYATEELTGYQGITQLLQSQGYELVYRLDTVLEIYQKQ